MKLELSLISSLVLLTVLLAGQIFWRPFLQKYARWAYIAAVVMVFSVAGIYSYLQFNAWHSSPSLSQYLLPPYQPINYFVFYVFARYWSNYVLSFLFSLLALTGARWLNERFGERFFYLEEPYLIASVIAVIGNPLWLFYLITVLVVYFLYILVWLLATKKNVRMTFYYFWLPIGIGFLLAIAWISQMDWFKLLKI